MITQIGVPNTTADYGVLIPLPSEPTLDSTPVASADIDNLDRQTAPRLIPIRQQRGRHPGSRLRLRLDQGRREHRRNEPGVRVSAPVAIGPVTAVTLTADTGDAINGWLADNGFVIPAADQSLVADYAGPGRYFIAIRRSDTAATHAPSSVGVHFTLAGDQRGLPMRFARLGGAPTVAFTVFVAAYTVAAPADPFAALTIDDLDRGTLNNTGYAGAVSKAVSAHGNHAFVLEGSWSVPTVPGGLGPSLAPFMNARQTLTRMSTRRGRQRAGRRRRASTRSIPARFRTSAYTQRTSGRHPRAAFAFAGARARSGRAPSPAPTSRESALT